MNLIDIEELVKLIGSLPVQHSGAECGEAIHKFGKWFLSLTEEEKMNIAIDYFKNPPTDDDQNAINEWKNRHPNAWINQFN